MVAMSGKIKTIIVDIGARYGLHPTWKGFAAESEIYLIEAEERESKRLEMRYSKNENIHIIPHAISGENGTLELRILNNPAMSGSYERLDLSPLFWGERSEQQDVKEIQRVKCITLEKFANEHGLCIDFLKLDTEGSEFDILKSTDNILDNVLGIRSEVSFDNIFNQAGVSFGVMHDFLVSKGFCLLNLDYLGQGDYFSDFVSATQRFGILQSTDAVWIKSPHEICQTAESVQVIKLVSFLFLNNAPDVALYILENSSQRLSKYSEISSTKLLRFSQLQTMRHLYSLKWIPGQSIRKHKEFYEYVFDDAFLEVNQYNESEELNPV